MEGMIEQPHGDRHAQLPLNDQEDTAMMVMDVAKGKAPPSNGPPVRLAAGGTLMVPPLPVYSASPSTTFEASVDGSIGGPTLVPGGKNRRKRKPSVADDPDAAPGAAASSLSDPLTGRGWTKDFDQKLRAAVASDGPRNWKAISEEIFEGVFTDTQCLNRWYKVLRPGLVKGPWTKEEDDIIIKCMSTGVTKWSEIADRIPGRLGKQCRERWLNHLDPSLKKGDWSEEEDAILLNAQAKWGNSWTRIAELLPGRSENAVKNRWNSASHTRSRCARVSEGGPPPPEWKEAEERQAVRDYCNNFEEGDSLAEFIPWVMSRLHLTCPEYKALDCVHLPRLHQRLRDLLDEEAVTSCPQDSTIHRLILRKRTKLSVTTTASAPLATRPGRGPAMKNSSKGTNATTTVNNRRDPEAMMVDRAVGGGGGPSSRVMMVMEQEDMVVEEERPTGMMTEAQGGNKSRALMMAREQQQQQHQRVPGGNVRGAAAAMKEDRGRRVMVMVHGVGQGRPRVGRHDDDDEGEVDDDGSVSSISSISTMSREGEEGKEGAGGAVNMTMARRESFDTKGRQHHHHHHHHHHAADFRKGGGGKGDGGERVGSSSHGRPTGPPQHQRRVGAPSVPPPPPPVPSEPNSKSRLRDVISLLFSAMRREANLTKRGLYQDALDAATQELPAMVNFVEGVLGSSASTLDLDLDADRQFLLESILTATQRGIFR